MQDSFAVYNRHTASLIYSIEWLFKFHYFLTLPINTLYTIFCSSYTVTNCILLTYSYCIQAVLSFLRNVIKRNVRVWRSVGLGLVSCGGLGWVSNIIGWVEFCKLDPLTCLCSRYEHDTLHTHTHTPVYWPFVRDYPGEPVPERQNQSGFDWSKRQWEAVASAGPYAAWHTDMTHYYTVNILDLIQ